MYISYAGELFLRMLKANFRKQMTLQKSQYAKNLHSNTKYLLNMAFKKKKKITQSSNLKI